LSCPTGSQITRSRDLLLLLISENNSQHIPKVFKDHFKIQRRKLQFELTEAPEFEEEWLQLTLFHEDRNPHV